MPGIPYGSIPGVGILYVTPDGYPTPAQVARALWDHGTRTLTSASTAPGVGLTAQKWAVLRGDNLERTFETIAADSSITKAQITVKTSAEITDDDAVIAVDSESGLIRVNGESPGAGQTASFSISSGDLEIPASVIAEIEPRNYSYDVQVWRVNDVATIEIGKLAITGDITRTITPS